MNTNFASGSRNVWGSLIRTCSKVHGLAPVNQRSTSVAFPSCSPSLTQARRSHIGSAPIYLPPSTEIDVLPFPPHPNPAQPLPHALRKARSLLVTGPKGEMLLPLHDFIRMHWENLPSTEATSSSSSSSATTPTDPDQASETAPQEPRKLTLSLVDEKVKAHRGQWGLTRALIFNALHGVSEGHSLALRLVGVGYRAAVEEDPLPRTSNLQIALSRGKNFFISEEHKQAEIARMARLEAAAKAIGPYMRLNLRLGYSHPVLLPIPLGIVATTPQPNRILLRGADKEALGAFGAQIRRWRAPEPYKGKGIFVDDETIKLKTAKKK
ncbi:hypothetical protein IE53DRAFT_389999 [Violaceomyces palustris]|uniref:Uncharacterized protein n=1 Tax=Violaceomyces palustris TaxID=1673888 RepID=A0ACD0NPZ5_9BASI|nr:hypothetical protein IE53DRAFT_389999 [Violaceomyces palustris]